MIFNKFNLAWICLLYRCNSRCEWCYAGSNHYEEMKDKVLPLEKQDGIINLLNELSVPRLTLIGGEPTLYPSLNKIIRKITNKGMKVGMVTNGRKFNDKNFVRELKESGLEYATISIEGSNEDIHDKTTQVKGSFYQAINGIKNAREVGLKVSTNTVISSSNINDLENIVATLSDKGIENISFNVCGISITEERNNQDYVVPLYLAAKAFEKAHKKAKEVGAQSKLVTPLPRCDFNELGSLKEDKAVPGGPCQIITGKNFIIDYNGDVLPCTHFGGYSLFNINKGEKIMSSQEFIEAFNGIFANEFRKEASKHPSIKCEGCKENCAGGCPIYWLKLDPEKEIRGHRNLNQKDYFSQRKDIVSCIEV